ncbi:hypothetical protein GGX14DRAFT_579291 [Mycena pura]|uniref:Uncharacterized protein n=1 Tax=Mycena pura TaxID=153505 RepID=A0AAD6UMY3_9AGAR|nr:hypothetical protein GGX14DRAFT_579291 [Mycena pura]
MHHCQSKKTSNRATFPSFTTPVCICGNATMQTACLKFICHITTWFSTREPIAKVCSLYLTGHSVEQRQGRYPVLVVLHVVFKLQPEVHAGAVDEWPWTPVLSLFVRSTRSETSSTRSVQLPLWRAHTAYPHSPSPRLLTHDHRPAGQQGGPTRAARQGSDAPARDAHVRGRRLASTLARPWGWAVERITDFFFRKPVDALPVDERLHVLVTTYEGQPVFFLCFRLTLTYRTKREKARPEEPLLPPRRCFRSSCALSPPSPYEHAACPETADAQSGPLQLEAALVEEEEIDREEFVEDADCCIYLANKLQHNCVRVTACTCSTNDSCEYIDARESHEYGDRSSACAGVWTPYRFMLAIKANGECISALAAPNAGLAIVVRDDVDADKR